ncbi:MAG TPA: class IV adenylate cyclase [Chloroflexi bacterium]|nr:class IV adenylate cyclase [Chloroflexota bacterium]
MAANIEIKAKVNDPLALQERAESLSDTPASIIHQEDIFFHTPQGRLKLRILAPDRGELIHYQRSNAAGPKRSDYLIASTADPTALKAVLTASLGERGVVKKRRTLYLAGNTRIHLDEVEGLGDFMELEVVLGPGQNDEAGETIASELMAKLGIAEADLIDAAYIDLLANRDR